MVSERLSHELLKVNGRVARVLSHGETSDGRTSYQLANGCEIYTVTSGCFFSDSPLAAQWQLRDADGNVSVCSVNLISYAEVQAYVSGELQEAERAIELAEKHRNEGAMASSAALCVEDARLLFAQGFFTASIKRAIDSLGYSVGINHPDHVLASTRGGVS